VKNAACTGLTGTGSFSVEIHNPGGDSSWKMLEMRMVLAISE